jgi:hypothetical protein
MVAECRHHETRIPAAERQRSRASPVSLNLASFEGMASHALMISPIGASTEAPRKLILGSRQLLGRIYSKLPSVFGAVNLEHAGRPTLSQRTGA